MYIYTRHGRNSQHTSFRINFLIGREGQGYCVDKGSVVRNGHGNPVDCSLSGWRHSSTEACPGSGSWAGKPCGATHKQKNIIQEHVWHLRMEVRIIVQLLCQNTVISIVIHAVVVVQSMEVMLHGVITDVIVKVVRVHMIIDVFIRQLGNWRGMVFSTLSRAEGLCWKGAAQCDRWDTVMCKKHSPR